MARTPKTTIFKGISAIEAAGGIDGFVREVLAEAQRLAMQQIKLNAQSIGPDRIKQMTFELITDVMLRRLRPDFDRRFMQAVGQAVAACKNFDQVEAAEQAAIDEVCQWTRDVTNGVLAAMH